MQCEGEACGVRGDYLGRRAGGEDGGSGEREKRERNWRRADVAIFTFIL